MWPFPPNFGRFGVFSGTLKIKHVVILSLQVCWVCKEMADDYGQQEVERVLCAVICPHQAISQMRAHIDMHLLKSASGHLLDTCLCPSPYAKSQRNYVSSLKDRSIRTRSIQKLALVHTRKVDIIEEDTRLTSQPPPRFLPKLSDLLLEMSSRKGR